MVGSRAIGVLGTSLPTWDRAVEQILVQDGCMHASPWSLCAPKGTHGLLEEETGVWLQADI
jgi:hypothetical protein